MKNWLQFSYQKKLNIYFILFSCIPAIVIGLMAYQKTSNTIHSQTQKDLDIIVTQLNAAFERQISDFDRFTMLPYYLPDIFSFLNEPIASKEDWGSKEITAQRMIARLMSAYPSINSSISGLIIYGMNGSINGYRMDGDEKLNYDFDMTEESWYSEVIESGGGFVTSGVQEIHMFQGNAFAGIIGSRLLRDDNFDPLAVIAIVISPQFIKQIVRSLNLDDVQVVVLDKEDNIIFSSEEMLAANLQHSTLTEQAGNWETKLELSEQTVTYMGNYVQSDYLGWTVYMGVNKADLLNGVYTIRELTLTLVILVILLSAIVSWYMAKGLSRPIYRLIQSMREVEKGRFSILYNSQRKDEIGHLETTYIRMVHRLDELVHSIEIKERQKREAELYAQRARIQPHFLYNTLNSIRMLAIIQENKQISGLIHALNKLLHANMKYDSNLITINEELELLASYVRLMDLRYTNVFQVEWQINNELKSYVIPPMVTQVLLENAIYHGAKGIDHMLHIIVRVDDHPNHRGILIEIIDDGVGIDPIMLQHLLDQPQDHSLDHIGLRNVRDRIRLCFGEEYGVYADSSQQKTNIMIHLPYQKSEKGT